MAYKVQQLILAAASIVALVPLISGTAEAQGAQGKEIFRFDTFGDEQLWTDNLGLHKVVEQKVDPNTALKVGLKVDAEALPPGTLEKADLKNPATTVALLKLNAVVGLKAEVDANNHITRLGVTCALCHSTVDDSVKPGLSYMVGPIMRTIGPPDLAVRTMAMPHLMFYAPNLTNEDIGAVPNLANHASLLYPFVNQQGIAEHTYMIQLIGESEKARILADEKPLVDALCTYRQVLCLTPDSHH
jgi:hypothetical protein